ncbi:MAG: hypothetical protein ACJASR_001286 [Psychroserpens sp.]|jgi:hypothetical protein
MKRKKIVFLFIVLCSLASHSQTYFYEDFNYESFDYLDSLFQNKEKNLVWRTEHASENVDISENGIIDIDEKFKKTSIVQDTFDKKNKILRFELDRVSAKFYAKYSCDDDVNDNVINDLALERSFDSIANSYCTDCGENSPLRKSLPGWKTHLNRNEIAINGDKQRRLYKVNREHWFGLNMLIDSDYEIDSNSNAEVVTQFHVAGRKALAPAVALIINKERFVLIVNQTSDGNVGRYDLGPVVKDKWISWKYHMMFSKRDKKGLIEIWRDGELMQTIEGRNKERNYKVYLKIGIYKSSWWYCKNPISTTNKKVISFDKIWANNKDFTLVLPDL